MTVDSSGLFETLRVDAGEIRDLEAHLDRLFAGLGRIGLAIPEDRHELAAAAVAVAAAAPRPAARLRITVTREGGGEPKRRIAAFPYEPPAEEAYARGVAAVLSTAPRLDSRDPLAGLKSLARPAYQAALDRALAAGAFEGLLLNERGRPVEGARSNLAVVLGESVVTPPVAEGCLPGTVRRRLLEAGALGERPLELADLFRAREVMLMNSLIGVLPVGRLDGRAIAAGPVAGRLRRLAGF